MLTLNTKQTVKDCWLAGYPWDDVETTMKNGRYTQAQIYHAHAIYVGLAIILANSTFSLRLAK